ncbi:hypothetical protein [Rubrimonas cliftonensis]|uniref:Helix-hairpin-helix domain-containing protein n=1 Tax=Rubrimonas cliftonensis TaxID=89524 RepID=A0A1H4AMZ6_9RHOB|nr:hypothetical protein [Rubrimonas cliftonensis]SEA37356.1 hypothetical protein SAMN05444370_104301 [Rubrimonas cliftonensis]
MTNDADYRARARAVRAEARTKLREFRIERRAGVRRPAPAEGAPALETAQAVECAAAQSDPYDDMSVMSVSADAARLAAPAEDDPDHETPAPALAASFTGSAPDADPEADPGAAELAEPAARPTPTAAPATRPATPPLRARRYWNPQPSAMRPAPRIEDGPEAIAALPGVGPGLVWLLGQAGVATLHDLAASDPDALADRLGLVGRLVDVQALRALASARLG